MSDSIVRKRVWPNDKVGRFLRDETGAITVDWVVLTGSIVLLGIAAGFAVSANVPGLADKVSVAVSEQDVGT